MKRILQIVVLGLCLSVQAQISFEKGYLINNANERIECYIKNMDWKDNPTEFEYKISLAETKPVLGNIVSVKEFSIEGESKYKRFEVNIEKSNGDLRYLTENKNPVWIKQTLFLKILTEGDASLYSYSENNSFKYFYNTQTIPMEQLICIKYKSTERNSENVSVFSESIKTNNFFRQQLYNNAKVKSMSDIEYENIGYNAGSLLNYFNKYNNQDGKSSNYTTKVKKGKINLKLTAGVGWANLSINDPNSIYSLSTEASKVVYNFGAEFEWILPFNKNKWSLFVNPLFENFEVEKRYTNPDGFPVPHDIEHKAVIKYPSFEVLLGLRHYMFLNENSKLFLSAIYSSNFSSSDITFDDETKLRISPRNNFAFGIGYTYKNKYAVELRQSTGRNILGDYIEWNGQYTTTHIQFSYKVL